MGLSVQSRSPAVADIIGAGREATVAITSAVPIPDRYVLVVAMFRCPSCRCRIGSGTPSRASSTAYACLS